MTMNTHGEIRTAGVAPLGAVLATFLLQVIGLGQNVIRAMEHRRAVRALGALDEHMLRDIGLTRGDVRDAAAEPLWTDPSVLLVRRAVERRAAAWLRTRGAR
ncbi:DUF1127 domain-containing protein [Roseixanthobacter glucoisosaccharinicivorans]|uniref:DUF1127 domain-containing protein n=1 Tax=Roseixanthobacter glucoisosaccharinicivorans TaxID=3119923 RepID=UPI003727E703